MNAHFFPLREKDSWRHFGVMLLLACAGYFALFITPQLFFDDFLRIYPPRVLLIKLLDFPMPKFVPLFESARYFGNAE